ncbi:MAG: hypothetical protein IIX01_06190 [Clostridia bacterium]|nr:hypothetical protein [Clostridia bacterium]
MSNEVKNEREQEQKFYLASLNAEILRRLQTRSGRETEEALLSVNLFKSGSFSSKVARAL